MLFKERVLSEETCCGRTSAICIFIDEVTSYNGWGYQFLDALHYTGHDDLAVELYPGLCLLELVFYASSSNLFYIRVV